MTITMIVTNIIKIRKSTITVTAIVDVSKWYEAWLITEELFILIIFHTFILSTDVSASKMNEKDIV